MSLFTLGSIVKGFPALFHLVRKAAGASQHEKENAEGRIINQRLAWLGTESSS